MRRRTLLGLAGTGALAAGFGVAWRDYDRTLDAAWERSAHGSSVILTRSGAMEYAEAGDGPPILMIHGTGGGFDQGLLFAQPLVDAGWRVISPSRFGYLGSAFPEDHSSEAQADAFIDLLDHLGIDSLPVAGGSAGALSALAFAIRHPSRYTALVPIVPVAYVPGRPAPRPPSALAAAIIRWGLRSDALFWAGIRLAPDEMIASLLATDPALVHRASEKEQARATAILRGILPVSAKFQGLLNDASLAGDPVPMALEGISAPVLAISAEDDRFLTADAARHIAATAPDARSVIFPEGGHIWIGHDDALFTEVDRFLRDA
ncbi:MAG TPA: alpha/beta hydrolase [Saliniramus sp.]|nr:alpha/beta hydrolase [Saliniramus sp.]